MSVRMYGRQVAAVIVVLLFAVVAVFGGKLIEDVGADEIVVIQDPIDGELHWYTSQGVKWQGFGAVTTYQKRDIYEFAAAKIRFNDGGHADLVGSIQYDMPLDVENLTEIHVRYGSPDAVKRQVVETVVNKVLYMTGPLMSSRESYAEKRTDLIRFVQDQVDHGVYRVETRNVEATDPISGQRTTQTQASIALDADGVTAVRQEQSLVAEFGMRAFNFAIESIDYDDKVEAQIAQ